ncbi:MAG: hypothetical protein LBI06_05485, partial [Treponema sp.]|nr:hypothetical protein [Treponema sp.]
MIAESKTAVIFRSLALFAILYQFRIVADDLADTAVFSATLFFAFASAVFLASLSAAGKKLPHLAAVAIIGLIPWLVRFFIALPRLAVPGGHFTLIVDLDSLLLNYDRNNFVSLLPFYWAAASTWFSLRSRTFLRAAVIADAVLLTAAFGLTRVSDFAVYRWPIVMIILLAGIIFLLALALLFSMPPEIKLRKSEKIFATTALLFLVFIGGFLFLKPSQEQKEKKSGGLLQPNLFSFDFSQFLRLDAEISMGDDLIMMVRKDSGDDHVLLRRSVLSGYNKRQGFFRMEDIDEKSHPHRLPSRPTLLPQTEYSSSQRVRQDYTMVNFDANAFIGMREPIEIIPYESWDSSSFKSAYSVESLASDMIFDGDFFWPKPHELGLSAKEFAIY